MDDDIDVISDLSSTNFFIYKEKQYPFNMIIFNLFSKYFNSKERQIQILPNSGIKLLEDTEDNVNLTEDSIKDFINYCQNQHIKLTKENVPFVYKLAKKYIVPSLIEATEKFISAHRKDFVIDYLMMNKQNPDFETEEYESMISKDMIDYITNDNLLSLSLPILYRIVTKYQLKNNDSENPPEFIEFLFKCLDHFGRSASVLFENFDFGRSNNTVIHKLLNEYSEKFDFHFINSIQLKTIYEMESEIIQREINTKQENDIIKKVQGEIKEKIDQISQNEVTIKIEIIQKIRDEIEPEIIKLAEQQQNEKIQKLKEEMEKKIEELKKDHEKQIHDQQADFTSQLNNLNEKIRLLSEKMEEKSILIEKLNREADGNKRKKQFSASSHFKSESQPEGIISILGNSVTISAGGSPCDLINLRNNDKKYFYNYGNCTPSSENDSYIKFDFGSSKRFDLHSYFIRTNGNSKSIGDHPKTWRIEGSNNDSNWTKLDRQVNNESLNGPYNQHHFICQESKYGNENNRYRYIRYIQEDNWWPNRQYYVWISYFELYGDAYDV